MRRIVRFGLATALGCLTANDRIHTTLLGIAYKFDSLNGTKKIRR